MVCIDFGCVYLIRATTRAHRVSIIETAHDSFVRNVTDVMIACRSVER